MYILKANQGVKLHSNHFSFRRHVHSDLNHLDSNAIYTHQCQLFTFFASALSSTIHLGSPSPHLAIVVKQESVNLETPLDIKRTNHLMLLKLSRCEVHHGTERCDRLGTTILPLRRLSMADENGMEEMNGKTEELALDNEPYDEDENGIFLFSLIQSSFYSISIVVIVTCSAYNRSMGNRKHKMVRLGL